jgi:hypothetical protein
MASPEYYKDEVDLEQAHLHAHYSRQFQPAKPAEEKAETKPKKAIKKPQFYAKEQRDADDDIS